MRISIFGLGYVGTVSAACLARSGHHIIGVDTDLAKLNMIQAGRSPVIEEGLSECIREGIQSGCLRVTSCAIAAVQASEVSMVCVGTPSHRNGRPDTSAVRNVVSQIGTALKEKASSHLVIVRSTVPPGTVNHTVVPILESQSRKQVEVDFDVCFNPEFLREGTSVKDFDHPPFTVVGIRHERVIPLVKTIYRQVQAPLLTTTMEAAEMVKYACNSFHALKIAFANEIGNLCKAMHVDSHEVMKIFCADTKLNLAPVYLHPGFAFGGSCLPKDLRALQYQAASLDQEVPLIRAIQLSNVLQLEKGIQMVLDTGKRKVGLLGLSFKAGTDDLRESPLVRLAERLLGKGLELKIYDNNVSLARLMGANKRHIHQEIPHLARLMVTTVEELFQHVQVIVIGTNTPEFSEALRKHATQDHTIIDLVRITHDRTSLRAKYQGICW